MIVNDLNSTCLFHLFSDSFHCLSLFSLHILLTHTLTYDLIQHILTRCVHVLMIFPTWPILFNFIFNVYMLTKFFLDVYLFSRKVNAYCTFYYWTLLDWTGGLSIFLTGSTLVQNTHCRFIDIVSSN